MSQLTDQHLDRYGDRFDAMIAAAADPTPEQMAFLRRAFRSGLGGA